MPVHYLYTTIIKYQELLLLTLIILEHARSTVTTLRGTSLATITFSPATFVSLPSSTLARVSLAQTLNLLCAGALSAGA